MKRFHCKARQYSDQMLCDRCALQWDVNDPEPPRCLTKRQYSQKQVAELRHRLGIK